MHTCTCIDMRMLLKRSLKFLPTTAHSDLLLTQTAQPIPGSRGKGDTTGGQLRSPQKGAALVGEENQLNIMARAFLTGPYLPPPRFQCKPGAAGRPKEYPEELRESQKRSIRAQRARAAVLAREQGGDLILESAGHGEEERATSSQHLLPRPPLLLEKPDPSFPS